MQIWDFSSHLNTLAGSEAKVSQGESSVFNQAPLIIFKHKDEGYAIDWSPLVPGRLLSGMHLPSFLPLKLVNSITSGGCFILILLFIFLRGL